MQNDFPAEEKLPTEGGIEKTRFRSHSVGGTEQKTIVYTGLVFESDYLTQRECVSGWQSCLRTIIINIKNVKISSMYKG